MSLGKAQNHSAVPPLHLQRGGSGSRQHRIICVVIFGLLLTDAFWFLGVETCFCSGEEASAEPGCSAAYGSVPPT